MLIYSKVKLGVSPDINALASLIIGIVGSCVIFAGWLMRRTEQRRELEMRMAEHADDNPLGAAPASAGSGAGAGDQIPVLTFIQTRVRSRSSGAETSFEP